MNRIFSFVSVLLAVMLLAACQSKSEKLAQIAKEANEITGTPKELVPGLMIINKIDSEDDAIVYNVEVMDNGMIEAIEAIDNFAMKRTVAGLLKDSEPFVKEMKKIGFIVKYRYFDSSGNFIREVALSADDIDNTQELSTEEYLDIQVAQTAKILPTRVDEFTVMTGISRDGKTMVYRYDCDVDLIEQGVTPEMMKEAIMPSLGTLGTSYKRMNVSLRYLYYYQGEEQIRVDISSHEM